MTGKENFLGTWRIFECVDISPSVKSNPEDIEGAVFVLQDNGEVLWELPPTVDPTFPLFLCDCYEVVYSFVGVSVQMGAVSGHMFEFWINRPVSRDLMRLTFEGWCILNCQQILASQPQLDFSYSLLSAFTEGFFSDIDLQIDPSTRLVNTATKPAMYTYLNKEFKIHSVILELTGTKPEELSNLPTDVLEVALYFLYSQSLPSTLTRECANRCVQAAPARMTDFIQLCQDYFHRTTLRNKIVKLVNKVHSCAEEMLGAFNNNSVTTPSRFCYVIKLALRHAAVAFIKLVEICVLYGEEAPKLTRDERLEILQYAKTRLPIFLTQFIALLRCIQNDFSTVKPTDRYDIAAHVVPEIEILLDSLCNLMIEARDSCNDIWEKWSSNREHFDYNNQWSTNADSSISGRDNRDYPRSILETNDEDLSQTLYNIFREREVAKLHSLHSQINAICIYLAQKKENFEEMALASKLRCVSRNLEQLIEELPVFLLRLEEIMIAVDDRFQWKDFKFCLQLAMSQVCQTIHHLKQERSPLQKIFLALVDLIQSDEFYQSLLNLNLITKDKETFIQRGGASASLASKESDATKVDNTSGSTSDIGADDDQDDVSRLLTSIHGIPSDVSNSDLNLVRNLCTPKRSKDSILAHNAAKLLFSSVHADMIFELSSDTETVEIPSHRVIVAARCDWFRRALLSGMKESIQKRIAIHDCSVPVFQQFLRYVYTGQFATDISTDYLSELIALSDRYEIDGLKYTCEQELALHHLDENSVIYLLSMAEQFTARTLRRSCMEYIASNPGVMAKELFEELSPELQMEVYDITMWSKANRKVFSTTDELLTCPRYMLVPDSPPSSNSSAASSPSPSVRSCTPPAQFHSATAAGITLCEDAATLSYLGNSTDSHGNHSRLNQTTYVVNHGKQKRHQHSKSKHSRSSSHSSNVTAEGRQVNVVDMPQSSSSPIVQEERGSVETESRTLARDLSPSQRLYSGSDPNFMMQLSDTREREVSDPDNLDRRKPNNSDDQN